MVTKPKAEEKQAVATSWRDLLPIHPAAEMFSLMSPDELRPLGEDIRRNGLRNPVAFWTDPQDGRRYMLDGRNRADAMEMVGIDVIDGKDGYCHYEMVEGDPYAYVISANIHRRHLTAEQKRELIAKLVKAVPEKSDRQIGKLAKTSKNTVKRVRDDLEGRGQVDHVDKRTDTKGRKQPASKRRPVPEPIDASQAAAMLDEGRARRANVDAARTAGEILARLMHAGEATQRIFARNLPAEMLAGRDDIDAPAEPAVAEVLAPSIAEFLHAKSVEIRAFTQAVDNWPPMSAHAKKVRAKKLRALYVALTDAADFAANKMKASSGIAAEAVVIEAAIGADEQT
jgi:hypothetical protein